jgi:hypothetical protein
MPRTAAEDGLPCARPAAEEEMQNSIFRGIVGRRGRGESGTSEPRDTPTKHDALSLSPYSL